MKAKYCPCLGVKRGAQAGRILQACDSSVVPSIEGAAMNVRYRVDLSQAERDQLSALLSGGTHASRKIKRAQILVAADAGVSDNDIAASIAVGGSTVYRTKRRFVEGNLEAALSEEQRLGAQTHRQRRSPAGGDRLLEPARGPGALDAGAVGRRDGQAYRARGTVTRDGAPALGREPPQAVAQGHVVHSADRRYLRRPHGGCSRPVRRAPRSKAAGGMLR